MVRSAGIATLALALAGCGSTELRINVLFPDATARGRAYRLYLVAVDPGAMTCATLTARSSPPSTGQPGVLAQAQLMLSSSSSSSLSFPKLPVRPLLIGAYVYDTSNLLMLVGCAATEPAPDAVATIELGCAAGVPYVNGRCCQASCTSKACGADDGCGKPCQSGYCSPSTYVCEAGKCACKPNCTGRACGASDGCGGVCQTGTCSGGASCQAGKCVCATGGVQCGSSCCSPGQVCPSTLKCCTPSCGARVCGPDPTCGGGATACGSCPAGKSCNAQGQCDPLPTWTAVPSGTTATLYDLWGPTSNDLWAVGSAATILRWNGSSWSKVAVAGTSADLADVWGRSGQEAWAVGASGTILRWNGSSWQAESSGVASYLHAVTGAGSAVVAAGLGGKVLSLGRSSPPAKVDFCEMSTG
jgi:hypothetical protein